MANIVKVIKRSRVTQIWGDFINELEELYETGTPKEEIIEIQNKKNIKLTPLLRKVTHGYKSCKN